MLDKLEHNLDRAIDRVFHRTVNAKSLSERDHRETFRKRRQRFNHFADDRHTRNIEFCAQRGDTANDFSVERLIIKEPFASDDEVSAFNQFVESDFISNNLKPADELGANGEQPTSESTRRTRTFDVGDVDAGFHLENLRQTLKPSAKQRDLGR